MAKFKRLNTKARSRAVRVSAERTDNGPDQRVMQIEPWIGVDDLAAALGVSTDWVYEKAASGDLPSYKFGGHRRFRVSEIEHWASEQTSGMIATVTELRRRGGPA
jgi:excisionase family DNA binding protein